MKPSLLSLAVASALLLTLAGCGPAAPSPRAYNIKVNLDPALAGTSLQIDLVGANKVADLPKWESYSITEYWQPGNVMRRDANKATLEFGRGRPASQTFPAGDGKWGQWLNQGALFLVVIADLPGAPADRAGNADSRRLTIPLDRGEWGGIETIEILVQESGVRLVTPKKAG